MRAGLLAGLVAGFFVAMWGYVAEFAERFSLFIEEAISEILQTIESALPEGSSLADVSGLDGIASFGELLGVANGLFPAALALGLLGAYVLIWAVWTGLKIVWKFIPTLSW